MSTRRIRTIMVVGALVSAGLAFGQTPSVDTGSADFTKFVAIGDSLTAGVSDGGLSMSGQEFNLPSLVYSRVYGSATGFEQPWVSEPGIPARLELLGLFPTLLAPRAGTGVPLNIGLPRPYDNLGIPGADVGEILNATAADGGAFALVLRTDAFGSTALQQALALQPTFATVWVGNNDALGAAIAGTPALLTPLQDFDDDYTAMIDALIAAGVDMVIANIPDVTSIPFVTTVPPVLVDPTTNEPVIVNGTTVPLIGPAGTPLVPGDRVLLTATSVLAVGCGIPYPIGLAGGPGPFPAQCPDGLLPGTVVLDASEVAQVRTAILDYNAVIAREAARAGAASVDIFTLFNDLAANGVVVGGIDYDSSFLTGGVIGYDGIHPSAFGYAFAANAFVSAINDAYGARIPLVDLRPFVFGRAGGGSSAPLPAAVVGGVRVSDEGLHNLLVGLGVEQGELIRVEGPQPAGARPLRSLRPEVRSPGAQRSGGRPGRVERDRRQRR